MISKKLSDCFVLSTTGKMFETAQDKSDSMRTSIVLARVPIQQRICIQYPVVFGKILSTIIQGKGIHDHHGRVTF